MVNIPKSDIIERYLVNTIFVSYAWKSNYLVSIVIVHLLVFTVSDVIG